jgi:hypothetical protein
MKPFASLERAEAGMRLAARVSLALFSPVLWRSGLWRVMRGSLHHQRILSE